MRRFRPRKTPPNLPTVNQCLREIRHVLAASCSRLPYTHPYRPAAKTQCGGERRVALASQNVLRRGEVTRSSRLGAKIGADATDGNSPTKTDKFHRKLPNVR